MGMQNVILTSILVILAIAHVSNADFSSNSRNLIDSSSNEDRNVPVSPTPSPTDVDEKSKDLNNNNSSPPSIPEENPKDDERPINATETAPALPPIDGKQRSDTPKEDAKGGKDDTPKKKGSKHDKKPKKDVSENEKPSKSCQGMDTRCQDNNSLLACVKSFDDASKALVLLIQNKGDSSLKVYFTFSSPGNKQDVIEIPKLQTEEVNVTVANAGRVEIKLNAGHGYCVLNLNAGAPVFEGNYFQNLPSYTKFMTPMYGAYFILVTTLVASGVCACCWFRRRKRQNDVPYQELELSMPESAAATAETAEGWDEVWDDDWDEEKAVKSPGHMISANGLTSRDPKEDDWGKWDD